jgi:peptidoglycan/LPS O-acetylase OafA/YrhL
MPPGSDVAVKRGQVIGDVEASGSDVAVKRSQVIGDVEVLRAVAVMVTVFQHQAILTGGRIAQIDPYFDFWYGVDIFFVISGFVIVRSLLPVVPSTNNPVRYWRSMVAFWIRRMWRIWPTAWIWLAIVVLASLVTTSGIWGEPMKNLQDGAAIILHVQNLHRADANAFQGSEVLSLYWSLSLEEQFYFVLPFVLFAVPARWLPRVLIASIVLQLFLTRWALNTYWSGILWSLRSDGLLFGVLIALSLEKPWLRELLEPTFLAKSRIARCFNILLPLFLMSELAAEHVIWFGTGLIAVLSAWLVWVASYDTSYLLADGPFKRALLWVGSRSYAIYLIHVPSMIFAREIWAHLEPPGTVFEGPRYTILFILTAAILIITLSEANYRLVEVPLRRKGAAIAKKIGQQGR